MLVRPSVERTALVRVMVEAPTEEECVRQVERIVEVVEEEMGMEWIRLILPSIKQEAPDRWRRNFQGKSYGTDCIATITRN